MSAGTINFQGGTNVPYQGTVTFSGGNSMVMNSGLGWAALGFVPGDMAYIVIENYNPHPAIKAPVAV